VVRVTANQVLVLISLEDGRVLPIPPDLRKRFARFCDPEASQAAAAARPAKRGSGNARR
jgi:hypothetical protein